MKVMVIGFSRAGLVFGECFADLGYAGTPKDTLQHAEYADDGRC